MNRPNIGKRIRRSFQAFRASFAPNSNISTACMDHEPPIAKLHVEILWRIFQMNADMNDDEEMEFDYFHHRVWRPSDLQHRALTRTRLSSQVCRLWRRILLGSPSIRGQLIDVGSLGLRRHDFWAREVIRRSLDSPLHIKGPIAEQTMEYIIDLLDESWERVCVLDVKMTGTLGPRSFEEVLERIRGIVSRPAKTLQFFKIAVVTHNLVRNYTYLTRLNDGHIFAGEAPSLRVYCHSPHFSNKLPSINSLSNIHTFSLIDPSIEVSRSLILQPWKGVENIHTLSLIDPSIGVSTSHLLQALKGMQRLETLRIRNCRFLFDVGWEALASAKRLSLPLLDKIEFCHDDIHSLTQLMSIFEPLPGCTIHVQTKFPQDHRFHDFIQTLSRYADSYFKHHPPSALGLVLRRDLLIFKDTSEARLPDSQFYLCMRTNWSRIEQTLPTGEEINALFYPLTAHMDNGYFRCVKHLDISMESNAISAQTLPCIDLFRNLSELGAIETLAVYDPDLGSLNSWYAQLQCFPPPFPRLRTLQFRTQQNRYTAYDSYDDRIRHVVDPPWDPSELDKFLKWHKRLGIPIEVLEYTCPAHRRDLRFLEQEMEVVGLKVKWPCWVKEQWLPNGDPCISVEEYVFGSGNHSKLERWYHGADCLAEHLEYKYMSYDRNVVRCFF